MLPAGKAIEMPRWSGCQPCVQLEPAMPRRGAVSNPAAIDTAPRYKTEALSMTRPVDRASPLLLVADDEPELCALLDIT